VQLYPDLHSTQVGESVSNKVRFSTTPTRKSGEKWLCDQLMWLNLELARQSGFLLKVVHDIGEELLVGI